MCNACGFLCCAYDGFEKCGCDCPVAACRDECDICGENGCDGGCTEDFDPFEYCDPNPAPFPASALSPAEGETNPHG